MVNHLIFKMKYVKKGHMCSVVMDTYCLYVLRYIYIYIINSILIHNSSHFLIRGLFILQNLLNCSRIIIKFYLNSWKIEWSIKIKNFSIIRRKWIKWEIYTKDLNQGWYLIELYIR